MKSPSLSTEKKDYIYKICHMALTHSCDNVKTISPNIINLSNRLIHHSAYNYSFNGLAGYAISKSNSIEESEISNLNEEQRYNQLRSSFFYSLQQKNKESIKAINELRKECEEQKNLNIEEGITWRAKQASEKKVGLCDELSMMNFSFLSKLEFKTEFNIGLFHGFNFKHRFIALGCLEGCDPNDFNTWPEDTIILDPWLRCYFELKDMPYYWRDMGFADNWAGMQEWSDIAYIMQKKMPPEMAHIFFEKFQPENLRSFNTLAPLHWYQQQEPATCCIL